MSVTKSFLSRELGYILSDLLKEIILEGLRNLLKTDSQEGGDFAMDLAIKHLCDVDVNKISCLSGLVGIFRY